MSENYRTLKRLVKTWYWTALFYEMQKLTQPAMMRLVMVLRMYRL